MKYAVTTPPAVRVVDYDAAKAALRLPNDDQQDYVLGLIDAAIDYAQEMMAASLITQTITATYYPEDVGLTPAITNLAPSLTDPFNTPIASALVSFGTNGRSPMLKLPRGPVTGVVSVVDANAHALTGYTLQRSGHQDRIALTVAALYPVTVVYTAGFGATPQVIPPMIRQAILSHVGSLYFNRESVTPGTLNVTPHSLAEFYRLRSRNCGMG